ncbi:hypothetical protein [Marinomonas epiphytica]
MSLSNYQVLPDVTYWIALEISKKNYQVNLDYVYQGSIELDYLYQLLTSQAILHWRNNYGVELGPVTVNNAFFKAVGILNERDLEFRRSRVESETSWVKDLLHL